MNFVFFRNKLINLISSIASVHNIEPRLDILGEDDILFATSNARESHHWKWRHLGKRKWNQSDAKGEGGGLRLSVYIVYTNG